MMEKNLKEIAYGIGEVRKELRERIDCLPGNLKYGSDGVWQREINYINALSFALETITGERYKRIHIIGDRDIKWV